MTAVGEGVQDYLLYILYNLMAGWYAYMCTSCADHKHLLFSLLNNVQTSNISPDAHQILHSTQRVGYTHTFIKLIHVYYIHDMYVHMYVQYMYMNRRCFEDVTRIFLGID